MRERHRFEREMRDLELEGEGTSPRTPIIFIPGVTGSELSRGNETVWPTNDRATVRSLELDENGEDIGDAIVPSRVMRRIPLRGPFSSKKGPFTWPVYEGFFTFFTKKGYKLGTDLFEFPYDWRKDMEVNSLKLGIFIDDIRERTHHDKVILIAHSLGGLVARSLMMITSVHKNIEKLFLLGSPHHGAPRYLSLLLFGKEWPFAFALFGIKLPSPVVDLNEQDAKRLVRNFTSIYVGAMDFTSKIPLIFEFRAPVRAGDLKSLHPGQYNDWMIERSINFHEALNRSWDRSPFYNTFLLVTLDIPTTINAVHMSQGRFSHYDFASPVKGLGPGDETIPGFSSTRSRPAKCMHMCSTGQILGRQKAGTSSINTLQQILSFYKKYLT